MGTCEESGCIRLNVISASDTYKYKNSNVFGSHPRGSGLRLRLFLGVIPLVVDAAVESGM
jgi:hypothetical protein